MSFAVHVHLAGEHMVFTRALFIEEGSACWRWAFTMPIGATLGGQAKAPTEPLDPRCDAAVRTFLGLELEEGHREPYMPYTRSLVRSRPTAVPS